MSAFLISKDFVCICIYANYSLSHIEPPFHSHRVIFVLSFNVLYLLLCCLAAVNKNCINIFFLKLSRKKVLLKASLQKQKTFLGTNKRIGSGVLF
jgi:hypothetical protein